MTCTLKDRDNIISKYLMHELSDTEVDQFQAHFFECADCFEEIQFKRKALGLIQREGDILFPEMAAVTETQAMAARHRFLWIAAAIAAMVVVVAVVGYYYLTDEPGRNAMRARLNFDRRPPLAYNAPDVGRSASPALLDRVKFLRGRFNHSMNAYNECEYELALKNLAFIKTDMTALAEQLTPDDTDPAMLLREYYFYFGLTRFALAGSENHPPAAEQQRILLDDAIDDLQHAEDLTRRYQLGDTAKEQYFLGLSYGMAGQYGKAVEILRAIRSNDPRFDDREAWIDYWFAIE